MFFSSTRQEDVQRLRHKGSKKVILKVQNNKKVYTMKRKPKKAKKMKKMKKMRRRKPMK
jgi:peptidyl-tRNA hydrolase